MGSAARSGPYGSGSSAVLREWGWGGTVTPTPTAPHHGAPNATTVPPIPTPLLCPRPIIVPPMPPWCPQPHCCTPKPPHCAPNPTVVPPTPPWRPQPHRCAPNPTTVPPTPLLCPQPPHGAPTLPPNPPMVPPAPHPPPRPPHRGSRGRHAAPRRGQRDGAAARGQRLRQAAGEGLGGVPGVGQDVGHRGWGGGAVCDPHIPLPPPTAPPRSWWPTRCRCWGAARRASCSATR